MIMVILKWVVPLLVLVLLAAAVFTKKTFHTEIFIPASQEEVWKVLIATEEYKEWNPVNVDIVGEFKQGGRVKTKFVDPKGAVMNITAKVKAIEPHRLLQQGGGIPGVLTFNHQWILEEGEGGTKVIQHEVDKGFYLLFWDSSWIEPAYAKASAALKQRVLSRQGGEAVTPE